MSVPVVEKPEAGLAAAEQPEQLARGRRLFALALIVLGVLILAVNLGLFSDEARRLAALVWPAGVIGVGVMWLRLGDRVWREDPAPFTVARGEARDADLEVKAGTADVRLEAGGEVAGKTAALAHGELPVSLRPQVTLRDQHTTVRLETLWGLPTWGRGRWSAALANDLPWQLNVSASTGNLNLDLQALAPQTVSVRSTFGDVDLTLPAAGGADLDVRLSFGDLTIRVPDGLGVKVMLHAGALAEVTRDERRFIQLAPHEIGTPLYAVAAKRCTLAVWLGTGRLQLK
jgi:hypothetical protein